ncbi:hypothetical protein FRC03_010955 [Tulasnella sp. 419]|nr:hypothetical protein FRC03_010955 [Tulasnella sp. 419]
MADGDESLSKSYLIPLYNGENIDFNIIKGARITGPRGSEYKQVICIALKKGCKNIKVPTMKWGSDSSESEHKLESESDEYSNYGGNDDDDASYEPQYAREEVFGSSKTLKPASSSREKLNTVNIPYSLFNWESSSKAARIVHNVSASDNDQSWPTSPLDLYSTVNASASVLAPFINSVKALTYAKDVSTLASNPLDILEKIIKIGLLPALDPLYAKLADIQSSQIAFGPKWYSITLQVH